MHIKFLEDKGGKLATVYWLDFRQRNNLCINMTLLLVQSVLTGHQV